MCTLIESLGLKDSQEKAIKDLVKNEIYQMFDHESIYIAPELALVIRMVKHKEADEAKKEGIPAGVYGDYELTFTPKVRTESAVN